VPYPSAPRFYIATQYKALSKLIYSSDFCFIKIYSKDE